MIKNLFVFSVQTVTKKVFRVQNVVINVLTAQTSRFQPVTTQSRLLMTLRKKPFENIVGEGENAGYQHFLLFSQCFLSLRKPIQNI